MADIRGLADLIQLWRAVPLAVAEWSIDGTTELDLLSLNGALRHQFWTSRCALAGQKACCESELSCAMSDSGRCVADNVIPVYLEPDSPPKHRMSALHLRWLPRARALRLVAIGAQAIGELGECARFLMRRLALTEPGMHPDHTFGDWLDHMFAAGSNRWAARSSTPWVVHKDEPEAARDLLAQRGQPDVGKVGAQWVSAVTERACKFTNFCTSDETTQRLAAHLCRHVSDAVMQRAVLVNDAEVHAEVSPAYSASTHRRHAAIHWSGNLELQVADVALPWLALVALCGIGRGADKGFGDFEWTTLR